MGLFFVIKSDSDKQPELKCISDKMCHKKAFKNKEIIMMNYVSQCFYVLPGNIYSY